MSARVLRCPCVLWGFFVQMCPRSVLWLRYLVTLSCTEQTSQTEAWWKLGDARRSPNPERTMETSVLCSWDILNAAHLSVSRAQRKGNQAIHFVNFIASTKVRSLIFQRNCFHQEQCLLPGRLWCAGGHCCYSEAPWQAREWAALNLIQFKKAKCHWVFPMGWNNPMQ